MELLCLENPESIWQVSPVMSSNAVMIANRVFILKNKHLGSHQPNSLTP